MTTVVHVTHEAVHKVGGIGAVLTGLITAGSYRRAVERTILVGPLLRRPGSEALGPEGILLHDSRNGVRSDAAGEALSKVEARRGVRILYGRRRLRCPDGAAVEPEVLLVDVESGAPNGLDRFKHQLYQAFGLASDRYEEEWEYELYVRLAEPAYEAVLALLGHRRGRPLHVLAHEFMGLPTAFKALLADEPGVHTLFYAHEVATARRLVERGPGGDARFYGALRAAIPRGCFEEDVFGPQDDFFKHALVSRAWRCHAVLAVGDLVVEELRFLGREFAGLEIDRVYNGLPPAPVLAPTDRRRARESLAGLVESLTGCRPRGVFTHVGRLVPSKGFWRDLQVLEGLEAVAPSTGPWALIVLATDAEPRPPEAVAAMRAEYGWPTAHREGPPDLTPGELGFDQRVRDHNARSRRTKVVFFNQFGFDAGSTGGAVPPGMGLEDLRRGSDAELGLSTYEPFGIAQVEALAFGALSVVSDACGCAGFLRQATAPGKPATHVCGGYTLRGGAGPAEGADPAAFLDLDDGVLEAGERACGAAVASALAGALPASDAEGERLLEAGHEAASEMSWERIVTGRFLPVLRRLEKAGSAQ